MLLLGAFSTPSAAGPTLVDIRPYVQWAVNVTGYPEPAILPVVRFVTEAQMQAWYCPGENCNIAGGYRGGLYLYVDETLPEEKRDEVLIHEITHFLHAPLNMSRCAQEYEATKVEWMYRVLEHGSEDDFAFNWEFYKCKPSDLQSSPSSSP